MSRETKKVTELTVQDLVDIPVWEFTGREKSTGPNEGSVRPRQDVEDPTSDRWARFAVRAKFVLNDGSEMIGYVIPSARRADTDEFFLGYLAPAIISENGAVPFWFVADSEPGPRDVLPYYERLDRSASQVFPLRFDADVRVSAADYVSSGEVQAFSFVVHEDGGFRLVKVR